MEASVRMTSSSAVLREFPIQSCARKRAKTSSAVPPAAWWSAGNAEAPPCCPQPGRRDAGGAGGRGEVVVVGQSQVGLVRCEHLEDLGGFVFADPHVNVRMAGGEAGDDRQQELADGGGESGDPQGAAGF